MLCDKEGILPQVKFRKWSKWSPGIEGGLCSGHWTWHRKRGAIIISGPYVYSPQTIVPWTGQLQMFYPRECSVKFLVRLLEEGADQEDADAAISGEIGR